MTPLEVILLVAVIIVPLLVILTLASRWAHKRRVEMLLSASGRRVRALGP
ncbi:MAG: hypothetical protein JXR97_05405 [Planctomycetes bacterium]|nr:hypothetical protein [Planctomycetota bacterium]